MKKSIFNTFKVFLLVLVFLSSSKGYAQDRTMAGVDLSIKENVSYIDKKIKEHSDSTKSYKPQFSIAHGFFTFKNMMVNNEVLRTHYSLLENTMVIKKDARWAVQLKCKNTGCMRKKWNGKWGKASEVFLFFHNKEDADKVSKAFNQTIELSKISFIKKC